MAVHAANDTNYKEFLNQNKPVAIKFFADWCGNCRLFTPKFKRVSNEDEMQNITFLEVDAEKNPEIRKAAGVDNLPYLAVFNASGILVEGSASSKEEYLRELLEKVS